MELFKAFLPILGGIFRGQSIGQVLASLSFKQWADIAATITKMEGPEIRKVFQEHPIFKTLLEDILKEATPTHAAANAHAAAVQHARKP